MLKHDDGSLKENSEISDLDLIDVNIGPYYADFIRTTKPHDRPNAIDCVATAMCSMGHNLSESFNERQFSIGKQVVSNTRCRMLDDLVEWRVLLRMNEKFMQTRKEAFAELLPYLDVEQNEGVEIIQ